MPSTPQRNLPGTFLQTPAPSRTTGGGGLQSTIFRNTTTQSQNNSQPTAQTSQQTYNAPNSSSAVSAAPPRSLNSIERAARTINNTLDEEARYPAIDNYLPRKCGPFSLQVNVNKTQRATPTNMTSQPPAHGRPFRRSESTTFPIRYSSSTINRRPPSRWDCFQRSTMPGLLLTIRSTSGTTHTPIQNFTVLRNKPTA